MDRRDFFKVSALGTGGLMLPSFMRSEVVERLINKNISQGHIKMKLGVLEIFLFSDGSITLENPQPIFAPEINADEVQEELRNLYLADDKLEGAINIMLIKNGEKVILVDTGSGHHFGHAGGHLIKNMENAGIKATDITNVFITHAHLDHIGGIISKSGTLVFPNAHYHLAQKEHEFWMSKNHDFSQSKNTENPHHSIEFAKSVLGFIKEKLTLFDYGEILYSCIITELAEGHTPGHTIFNVFSNDKLIQHIVDTVHTPLLIAKPEWGTQWDIDFEKGIKTRKEILQKAYLERTIVMTTHLPWPGLGYIGKKNDIYQWIPFSYFTQDEIII